MNQVKLELGLLLCVGVLLLLLVPRLSDSALVQTGILFAFGMACMAWIIFRVRQAVRRHAREDRNGQE